MLLNYTKRLKCLTSSSTSLAFASSTSNSWNFFELTFHPPILSASFSSSSSSYKSHLPTRSSSSPHPHLPPYTFKNRSSRHTPLVFLKSDSYKERNDKQKRERERRGRGREIYKQKKRMKRLNFLPL